MLIEYKNQKLWLENYINIEQSSRTVGRPVDRENLRVLQTQLVDRSVSRSLLRSTSWLTELKSHGLVHVLCTSVDRSVDGSAYGRPQATQKQF